MPCLLRGDHQSTSPMQQRNTHVRLSLFVSWDKVSLCVKLSINTWFSLPLMLKCWDKRCAPSYPTLTFILSFLPVLPIKGMHDILMPCTISNYSQLRSQRLTGLKEHLSVGFAHSYSSLNYLVSGNLLTWEGKGKISCLPCLKLWDGSRLVNYGSPAPSCLWEPKYHV